MAILSVEGGLGVDVEVEEVVEEGGFLKETTSKSACSGSGEAPRASSISDDPSENDKSESLTSKSTSLAMDVSLFLRT